MTRFAVVADDYPVVALADTDKPLPKRIDPHTRYAYFKTIARGGRSIIQSCKDLHLMRVVCYKSLKAEFANDETEQRRFVREARVSAMLQHPNTVPTYELARDLKGHPYFTMKLVHGYTLREILNYRDRYDLSRLVEVVIQVAHALAYAHDHGVAHRDIKPENVLVGPFGEVLVLDWGLAKILPQAEDETAVQEDTPPPTDGSDLQGTVSYMSPEHLRQEPTLDHRTDIYSLGAVLYEVLAGRPPVAGNSFDEIIAQTLKADIAPPSAHAASPVPSRLEEVCLRCLRAAPAERIESAGEVIRELQEDW